MAPVRRYHRGTRITALMRLRRYLSILAFLALFGAGTISNAQDTPQLPSSPTDSPKDGIRLDNALILHLTMDIKAN